MGVTMHAYRERATLWMRPLKGGRFQVDWLKVSFRSEAELVAAVETEARRLLGTDDVQADASMLGQKRPLGYAPGRLVVDGRETAIWGITSRCPDPTHVPADDAPAGSLLDEPQAPTP
jgi:hypothetical protein